MNKKLLLLSAISLFSICLTSCGKDEVDEEVNETQHGEIVRDKFIVQNGASEYSIITPEVPSKLEKFAASELSTVLRDATGANISIVSENDISPNAKYISIGKTKQFTQKIPNVDLSKIEKKQSSYFITTKDDNIYLNSSNMYKGYGSLYGVYDLLHDLVNYEYYHDQEIYYERNDSVNLYKYDDFIVNASIDIRSVSTLYTMQNETHSHRLRLMNTSYSNKLFAQTCYGHSQIKVFCNPQTVNPETGKTYYEEHPDWFINSIGTSDRGMIYNNLCWTAGDECVRVCADKMIEIIKKEPEAVYFFFGQEDSVSGCECDRCKRAITEWAGSSGGLQIDFTNRMIKLVKEWLKENEPEREIHFLIYAYRCTVNAPTKVVNGEYVPYSSRVIPDESLKVLYSPIGANYAVPLSSPYNKDVKDGLDAWKKVLGENLYVYMYDTNFKQFFVPFNNFNVIQTFFKVFGDAGANYIFINGCSDTNLPGFDEMRTYVESKLLWNTSLNYETLARDFMNHYYKGASNEMYDLYLTYRDRYAYYTAIKTELMGDIYGASCDTGLFPYEFVMQLDALVKKALSTNETSDLDSQTKELVKNRIMKEYLSVIYLEVMLYKNYFSNEELLNMKEIFTYYTTYFNITRTAEGGNLEGVNSQW